MGSETIGMGALDRGREPGHGSLAQASEIGCNTSANGEIAFPRFLGDAEKADGGDEPDVTFRWLAWLFPPMT